MKKLLLLILISFINISHYYATTITIGNQSGANTATTYPAPYGNWYSGAKHQMLILASELQAAGMCAGDINSLAFNVTGVNGNPLQDFTISLKNTTISAITTWETGLTQVYGPVTYTETSGWNVHTFSTPFYWDGVSNLVIETCFNNQSGYTNNAIITNSPTSFQSTISRYQDNTPNLCQSTFVNQTYTVRPDIQFDYTAQSFSPTAGFTSNTTFTCSGFVQFTDQSTSCQPITQWYWDVDGDNITDYTTQNPSHNYSSNGTYTVTLIACNVNGCDTLTIPNYITVNTGASAPVAANCYPVTQNGTQGFGITQVDFNTISNASADASEGYADFTCFQTTLYEGQNYTLSIQTTAPTTQNYVAWIDFNNDGIFTPSTEQIFSATSQTNTSGTVYIPTTVTLNTPLRLRIACDYDFSAVPTPCSNPDFGQVEDYTVIIQPNPFAPVANFETNETTSCDGTICFTDLSLNNPNGWIWDFGDGNTSNNQHPCHTYAADGTYTITLIAGNSNGTDTIVMTNYVTVNTQNQMTGASCTPSTLSYCCGYGIYNVEFNTINKSSNNASEGYKNFSCENTTTVNSCTYYTLTVRTGTNNPQDTRAWIDFDNDGSFNNTNELVMDAPNSYDPSVQVYIPSSAVTGTALRMRISSDVIGTPQSACDNNDFGQTEDYGVIISSTSGVPTPDFTVNTAFTCYDSIYFTDLTIGCATSWLWDFGDGTTSTQQNPVHFYPNAGVYDVKLKVCSASGCDSISKNAFIVVSCNPAYMPTSGQYTITTCSGTLQDDGGNGNYSNNTDGIITIAPTNASSVTLNFTMFDFVNSFPGDTLFIYDGPSTASPLLAALFGNATPSSYTSTGGSITIRQKTDLSSTDPGFTATWTCITSIEENVLENSISVYPNPTNNQVNIAIHNQVKVTSIIVYDMLGKEIINTKNINTNVVTLTSSNWNKGIYLIKISDEKGYNIIKKIIKN